MLGYHGDQELTDAMIDEDGYFRTGDLGRLDENGYVQILGRHRDIFNTPEGTNIHPERVEIQLESLDWVEQAFLVGDARPYVTAHLVVRPEVLHAKAGRAPSVPREEWDSVPMTDAVELRELDVSEKNSNAIPVERNEDLYDYVVGELARLNQSFERIEQVVAFVLYDSSFSPDAYKIVTAGKVNRDRPRFLELYQNNVETLYNDLDKDSLMLVPSGEHRYRFRTAPIIAMDQPKMGKVAL
jgi:long-subunit acyl-CoA synthetase (AMP-forming)